MKIYLPLLMVLVLVLCIPELVHAQNPQPLGNAQPTVSAEALSQELFCDVKRVLEGDIGLLLGLIVGFLGFMIILFKDAAFSGFVMIGFGVCVTAMPNFFISTMENMMALAASSGLGNTTTLGSPSCGSK